VTSSALPATSSSRAAARSPSRLAPLTLTAIGIVYGDIGTSPLYTIRECFYGSHAVDVTPENVLGVLSLVLYALFIVISIKYIAIVMRADNQGEGGILALTALLPTRGRMAPVLIGLGIFGAALLYGDGMITPAISVLGAVEGLQVEMPLFAPSRCRWRFSSCCSFFRSSERTGSVACSARLWCSGSRRSLFSVLAGSSGSRRLSGRSTRCMASPTSVNTVCPVSQCSVRYSWPSPEAKRPWL